MKKKSAKKKLKWVKSEVTWIKLNPEQAVLSCCDSDARGVTLVGASSTWQCRLLCGVTHVTLSSS